MRVKTPEFWYTTNDDTLNIAAQALRPLSLIYGLSHKICCKAKKPYKASIPVICIGNITAGGTGKTPTALALYDLVKDLYGDIRPCFLTRGYGGKERGPILVDLERHKSPQIGDEALLLAEKGPVIVSANRAEGAKLAENDGYDLIIMDDGMQNTSLHKDAHILVVDSRKGFGNGLMLPAGPLREPLQAGLKRADIVQIVGSGKAVMLAESTLHIRAHVKPRGDWEPDSSKPYIAFAGLGHPEKFIATLEECGLSIVGWHPYPDHYRYEDKDIKYLQNLAAQHEAVLITTEKDAKRLPEDMDVEVLPIRLDWEDKEPMIALLRDVIES